MIGYKNRGNLHHQNKWKTKMKNNIGDTKTKIYRLYRLKIATKKKK